ncbi:class I SAM-dependent DNA methyltransferase [Parapedobacter deserti]|uniref:Class I SAM-dependent DNA methyltransferase n=1 Tax=Parapedobacter deserti TaxID=1912957 RepID=A0ABV7JH45_9SPHI
MKINIKQMLSNSEQIKKADLLYDERYASIYNQIWCEKNHWKPLSDFYEKILNSLLQSSKNWLDVGCGTGYLLSKFSEVDRSGMDLSDDMLHIARSANPNATFYKQSMTEKRPELEGKFDLVTCTGQPYCYLPTMGDIELAIARLAEWTAKDGKCMVAPSDLVDIMDIEFPHDLYDLSGLPLSRGVTTLGVVWTSKEHDGAYYYQLCPHLDQLVRWFGDHFRKIEILLRPKSEEGTTRVLRRVIVASEKRDIGDDTPPTIILPSEPLFDVRKNTEEAQSPVSELSNKDLLKELAKRLKSGSLVKAAVKKIVSG